jgi:hypothetical protein
MPATPTFLGVYTEEIPSRVRTIIGREGEACAHSLPTHYKLRIPF